MALFGSFDFGKGLKKQAEAFSRSPTGNRARKLPQLLKQLDEYAGKFLATVISQSSHVNPGQLRSGAEALVDISILLQDGTAAYRVFAELAARSRKVAAVPQLGQLVDRLLEVYTDQKKERAALLTYRIVTGTLGSERYISYLRERAQLTEQSADWKDLALGIARLIRDGVVQANEELVTETLQNLVNNKDLLGDQSIPIQQMLAESMIQRRNHRQAEFILMEAAIASRELPDSFYDTVGALIEAKPETCWELHQLIIERSLVQFESGEADWPDVLQKLAGAKEHEHQSLAFLIEHALTPLDARLVAYVRKNLGNLTVEEQVGLINRFDQVLSSSGSAGLRESAAAPPPPSLGRSSREPQPLEYLEGAAKSIIDTASLRRMLAETVDVTKLDLSGARAVLRQLGSAGLPDWAPFEARIWLVERLTAQSRERIAVQLLDDLLLQIGSREMQLVESHLGTEETNQLLDRLRKGLGERSFSEMWLRIVRLCLVAGNFREAKQVLAQIPAAEPQSRQAFAELEHWITRQAQPTPWMLMTLSEARRDLADDPQAGLDVATQAALLAPNDRSVQAAYEQWTARVPGHLIRSRRLSQALYLLTREERLELLPTIISELEEAQRSNLDTLEWIDQLLPVVATLRGVAKTKTRETVLRLLAAAYPARLEAVFDELTADLNDEELGELLQALLDAPGESLEFLTARAVQLEESIASKERARVETEIGISRHNGRPIRYSAGELIPSNATPAARHKASPWRRSLAIARRKRTTGDADGAIRELQIALELDPQEAELQIELAETFGDKGQYKVARKVLKEVLQALDTDGGGDLRAHALYAMASVAEKLDDPAYAIQCLENAVAIQDDYRDSRERLAALKRKLTIESEYAGATPSNIAANVILEAILELLNTRAARAGVAA